MHTLQGAPVIVLDVRYQLCQRLLLTYSLLLLLYCEAKKAYHVLLYLLENRADSDKV